jgi:hypothetical protein
VMDGVMGSSPSKKKKKETCWAMCEVCSKWRQLPSSIKSWPGKTAPLTRHLVLTLSSLPTSPPALPPLLRQVRVLDELH